jgi:hypothetical protein
VRRSRLIGIVGAVLAAPADAHTFLAADGTPRATLTGTADLTVYAPDAPAPTLLFSDDDAFVAPRLTLFFDARPLARLRVHVQARVDRGFDPGAEKDGDVRLDEYVADLALRTDGAARLRAGKFATAFGAWVDRHLAWDNPFITAPALYEDVLPITDAAAPPNRAAFARRRDLADRHATWLPVLWGPSYASGAALDITTRRFDATLEVKNASLGSRPDVWDLFADGFDREPTVTAHLRVQPAPEWTLGASASDGPYLQERADATLPPRDDVDAYEQTTYGVDVAFARRGLAVWAELARASADVPRVGGVAAWSGFVEAKQKLGPQLWLAARLNRSVFDDVPGTERAWNRDLDRLDLALGYRFDTRVTAKVEWSISDADGVDPNGQHLLAASVIARF